MKKELNKIIALAYRDLLTLLRDKTRLMASLFFPAVFVGVLGVSFQENVGGALPYNFLTFVFLGVLAQSLFQAAASGTISLIEDRKNDFSQEVFVSPVSRYSIIIGKVLGESAASFVQAFGVLAVGILIGVPLAWINLLLFLPALLILCVFGAAFGVLVVSVLGSRRSAHQIFTFLLFPQFFLAGVFSPVTKLPPWLMVASRMAPLTYGVDFVRGLYYLGKPEYSEIVLHNPAVDLLIMGAMITFFLILGTAMFLRRRDP